MMTNPTKENIRHNLDEAYLALYMALGIADLIITIDNALSGIESLA